MESDMENYIVNFIGEHLEVAKTLKENNVQEIKKITEEIVRCFKAGNKVLMFGNGGSAADAQHFAAELVNDYKIKNRPALPVISLTTNTSTITSIGNDSNFDNIFSKQVEAFANKDDVVIVFTTSDIEEDHGHSTNIYKGVLAAKKKGAKVIGFIGERGQKISKLVDIALIVKSKNTPRVQECHELAYHIISELVENELFGEKV